jgi:hypothetical protein
MSVIAEENIFNCSAFFLFCSEERAAVQAMLPGLSLTELARELGRRWNLADTAERVPYEAMARDYFLLHVYILFL